MGPEYRIWGHIEQMGPDHFLAIACAVRNDDSQPTSTRVLNQMLSTRTEAEETLRELVDGLGQMIVRMGARVTDVETDGI